VTANVPRQLPPPSESHPAPIRNVLGSRHMAGSTGALRILGPPGGTVFLVDGRIAYAECPLASGVMDLLVASGRLTPDTWSAALADSGPDRRIGDVLVDRHDLTGAELELVTRTAVFGSALFHLAADAPTHFEAGVRHTIGAVRTVDFDQLCAEVDRRRDLLSEAWPDDAVDTAIVRPVRRLPGHHVALTSTQWAIVANADGLLSPIDLARLLGHDTFDVLLEARRLARVGLIEAGAPPAPAAVSGGPAGSRDMSRPAKDARPLPRRRAGRPRPVVHRRLDEPAVPIATLLRIRRGLEERL
jgi:hypothetical protein